MIQLKNARRVTIALLKGVGGEGVGGIKEIQNPKKNDSDEEDGHVGGEDDVNNSGRMMEGLGHDTYERASRHDDDDDTTAVVVMKPTATTSPHQ